MEKKLSKTERELLDSIVKHAAGRKRVRCRIPWHAAAFECIPRGV